jgi:Tol biopolymer transport system component/DNA-binding winged helix-turn-helix (wHTH) protein
MTEETRQVYEFDEFRIDPAKRQLLREGEVVPLYSKAFDLLLLLVESKGRDLSKDEILETIWPGQILEESNLTVNISAVRKALGEKAAQPRFLVTIPGRGYRFVARVREADEFLIQTQTISEITVEEEAFEDEPLAIDSQNQQFPTAAIAHQPVAGELTGRVSRSASLIRRKLLWAGLGATLVVLVLAAVFVVRRVQTAASDRFQQIKIRQLTNDGRTVNAAISPDGKFFVFVWAGKEKNSLRLGQMSGEGPIELLPPSDAIYEGLAFSPDGNSVYYVIDDSTQNKQTLYRLPVLGGVPVRLREGIGSFFAIAPDNKRVAFVRSDADAKTRNIVISDLDGGNESVVLTLPVQRELMPRSLSWSPDGSTIALGARPDEKQTDLGIFLLHLADHQLKSLSAPQWREIQSTVWLKDGSGIVAVAASTVTQESRQIWFISHPGGQTRRITNDLNSYDISLSATTDANQIMAVAHQQMSNIWVAPAEDLSKANQITFGALNRGDGGLGLDWTPDGRIVYASSVAQSKTIWIMDADGQNAKELTPPGNYETTPGVTGDGHFLVFESNRSGANEIWRTNIDGSDPKRLTTCGRNYQPGVSPDGKWVVYRSICEADPGLWRVSIDGEQPVRLTEKSGSWPAVSPDSKFVACEFAATSGKEQLAIIPIEGGPAAKLFEVPPLANFRYGVRWTPDGKAITYRDWGSGIWRQPLEGGPSRRIEGLPDEKIYSYGWSRDGKRFAFTRGSEIRDIILLSSSR